MATNHQDVFLEAFCGYRMQPTFCLNPEKLEIDGVKTEPNTRAFTEMTDLLLSEIKLSHCSGSFKIGKVDLNYLREKIPHSIYEPELHPGLMFKIDNVSIIIQHTGVVLMCGLKHELHMTDVVSKVWKLIDSAYGIIS